MAQFRDPLCARCKHPKSDHENGKYAGLVKPDNARCDCPVLVSRGEDVSQAAARIMREATEKQSPRPSLNHGHAVALHFMHYNFCGVHKSLRIAPAMQAGLTDHVWELEELAGRHPEPHALRL